MKDQFEAVIGLEVHCQLSTESKAFSSEPASFQSDPNIQVDPLSLGHPGTLPVYNEHAVDLTLKMGMATHSTINQRSVFARKHYFYPDLPKGYQISQYEQPICTGGYVEIVLDDDPSETRQIRLTRIHVEEDAGRSIHNAESDSTLLDFNRSGVPLIEIVTEPDIRTPREAYKTMRKIRQLVRYLDICDGNMEEGSLRCDANISIRPTGSSELGKKAEIKNINSFRFLERALAYEIERQRGLLEDGHEVEVETRLWDEKKGETRSMRSKEGADDYRYFPDPDLPPLVVSDEQLARAKNEMTSLPDERIRMYMSDWELPFQDGEVLTSEREIADYFEECVSNLMSEGTFEVKVVAKSVANFLMTHALETLKSKDSQRVQIGVDTKRFSELIEMRLQHRISSTAAVDIFEQMLTSSDPPNSIAQARNLFQVQDTDEISRVVHDVLANNPENVITYRNGKVGLIGFFIGQVMSKYPGSPDPKMVRALLEEKLGSSD
ncbi:MAG: Asp-tRNA(Asn)/Glu-tRNA(Gln) amidotransferase subunit GatB [Bacteroidetes bacterium]|nr:MAG: Asp-tRNA(Asn)/Glu-tRNA(Gln) amidotransferase subunit GatB [Bacteroidota bacterium]